MSAGPDALDQDGARGGTAIQKAFRLMQTLFAADGPQQLTDLAEKLDMPKPSVHRLLTQLEEVGAVQRDLSGRGYTVGSTSVRLAVDALSARAKQPPVRNIMRRLVDQIGESCNLSILCEHEVLYLERVECDWPLRMQLHAGSRVPVHATASGKLLLAQMTPRARRKLLAGLTLQKFTVNTITDPDELEAECKLIRARGYSTNREEYHLGLTGVSTPVLGMGGQVVATLSIHAPVFRMTADEAVKHLPLLRSASAQITEEAQLLEA
jgi:DNA-binding IclR family transcriptional regulator